MNKYQEALDRQKNNVKKLRDKEFVEYRDDFQTLQELVDKETPKKFKIMDRELIFHSTPRPTQYYLTIRCSCGEEFDCRGYQHWKVIDKNNVEKDYFEYEYYYCPHCGQKLDWSDQ